jgi:hypothetical protein
MSRSPHRLRGDAAEGWQALLFGEILREIGGAWLVREAPAIKLPRSGRWESGLGRITPALDDALGATAFAVAWRWACAERQANAWPGWSGIARHALDAPVTEGACEGLALASDGTRLSIAATSQGPGARGWRLLLPQPAEIWVSDGGGRDWSEVDRIADVAAAWLDADWAVV